MTHYDVLGVGAGSTPSEVRGAYRRAARRTHPDTGGDPVQFAAVQAAWEVLSSPAARDSYDRELAGDVPAPEPGWGAAVPFDDLETGPVRDPASDLPEPWPAAAPPARPAQDDPPDEPADPGLELDFDTYTSEPRVLPVFHVEAPTDPECDRRAGPRERSTRWLALGWTLATAALLGLFSISVDHDVATELGGLLGGFAAWFCCAVGMFVTRTERLRRAAVGFWVFEALALVVLTLVAANQPRLASAPALTLRVLAVVALAVASVLTATAVSASQARRRRRIVRATRHHQEHVDVAYRDGLARMWNGVLAAATVPGTTLSWLDTMTLTGHVRTAHAWDPRTRTWARVVVPDVAEPRTWVVLDPARSRVLAVAPPGADEAWSDTFAAWVSVRAAV